MKDHNKGSKRLIDANLNRLREGIRVVEEVARFMFDAKELALQLKAIRHDCIKGHSEDIIQERNTQKDTLKKTLSIEMQRDNIQAIVSANFKRSEESSRVLEEIFKLSDETASEHFKNIRYQLYALEKDFVLLFQQLN